MATHHDDVSVTAGDDWVIPGLLLDASGAPLDLTLAVFEWTLIDPDGNAIVALVNGSTLTVVEPKTAGQIQVTVPNELTEPLLAGRYHDALRVTMENSSSTYWVGTILVDCDLFSLAGAVP